jgi:hypothetical protein
LAASELAADNPIMTAKRVLALIPVGISLPKKLWVSAFYFPLEVVYLLSEL